MAIILGVDPGFNVTGYGIIHQTGCKLIHLGSGCIYAKKAIDLPSRLKLIYTGISDVISKFNPKYFAIEQIFIAKNINSALKLGQAQSVAVIAAINQNLLIFEYAASQVKQTIVGIGNADKRQVQYMVRNLLKLPINPQIDAADALAIGITHCYISQMIRK